MATVWVSEDTLLARRVAVKTLHPELAADPAVRARFRNEAIAAAGLAHPGIVTTYDTGEDDGVAYIVMELVEGPNLRRMLDEHGPLPVNDALRIARGVANALEEAHRNGIVHRDVKPANVLVPLDGPVKVTDFGIAKATGPGSGDLTSTGTIVGTARYLAPEQVRGEPADGRADVYALGLLIQEMLTGELPFQGDTEMATALARLSRPPAPLPASTPPAVAAIVARCLALEPDDRWQSAHELAAAIDVAARGGEIAAPTPPAGPPRQPTAAHTAAPPPSSAPVQRRQTRPPRRRARVWPWAILGGVLLGAGAGGGYLLVEDLDKKNGSGNGGNSEAAVQLVAAQDFDPEGDGTEHPEVVDLVIDGLAATSWRTESYSSQDLGGAKSGVGIYVELAEPTDISFVEVDTQSSGWNAQIYIADAPTTELSGWGAPVADRQDLGTTESFEVDGSGSAVLIWITRVPGSGRLEVSEIRVG
jgi:serine/threonine-protein kinase